MKVREIMSVNVASVRPDMTLKQAAALMSRRGVSGLPVVDEEGTLLGVVSEADIIVKAASHPEGAGIYGRLFLPEGVDTRKVEATTVGEAMTAPAVTVDADRPVAAAARLMVEHEINRLPVLVDGKVAGIVSRADLVQAFRRSDQEILDELVNEVLVGTLWLSPETVEFAVDDGKVTVRGRVPTRTAADLVEAFAWRVPGVVAVDRSELEWVTDDRARRRGGLRANA
jgi:CBS domain-containing protein